MKAWRLVLAKETQAMNSIWVAATDGAVFALARAARIVDSVRQPFVREAARPDGIDSTIAHSASPAAPVDGRDAPVEMAKQFEVWG
jgi:hypothetical protein